tara:strand:- start:771 stop:935 length:165 start_codon:yes stop_codon:yes gene_type:complete
MESNLNYNFISEEVRTYMFSFGTPTIKSSNSTITEQEKISKKAKLFGNSQWFGT